MGVPVALPNWLERAINPIMVPRRVLEIEAFIAANTGRLVLNIPEKRAPRKTESHTLPVSNVSTIAVSPVNNCVTAQMLYLLNLSARAAPRKVPISCPMEIYNMRGATCPRLNE